MTMTSRRKRQRQIHFLGCSDFWHSSFEGLLALLLHIANKQEKWRGEVWSHIIMEAKFQWISKILTDTAILIVERLKYRLPCCSWVQSCTEEVIQTIFSFFFFFLAGISSGLRLLRSRNFATMARWGNDFYFLLSGFFYFDHDSDTKLRLFW